MKTNGIICSCRRSGQHSLYNTVDTIEHNKLPDRVSELVDQGIVKSTLTNNFGMINAANVRRAHAQIESGQSHGRIILQGF